MNIRNVSRRGMFACLLSLACVPALAHHPEIAAEALCDENGELILHYTATSWLTTGEPGSGNSRVVIGVNGVLVDEGAFAAPSYSFSGSIAAPDGTSAVVIAAAVADWDNGQAGGQSTSITVQYPTDACPLPVNGRFTGGGHQVRVGEARVTRGLTMHCDLLLSNNLEVNWQGNSFHMTDHLETVACTDDPLIYQFPPDAPLDTLIGVGTGRYNGTAGYTIEFTLQDHGEPGSSDQMRIHIYETGNPGNVVLDVPLQVLSGGNLQAHYDQPHR